MTTRRRVPPTVTTAAGYVEAWVEDFIRARIRGEEWRPSPLPEHPSIIRLAEARRRVGLSNYTLWNLEQQGLFPKRIRLTEAVTSAAD